MSAGDRPGRSNEGFWFDRDGLPHTEKLHTIEKLTRLDGLTMRYEPTIDCAPTRGAW